MKAHPPRLSARRAVRLVTASLALATAAGAIAGLPPHSPLAPEAHAAPCQGFSEGSIGVLGEPGEFAMDAVYRAASQAGILNAIADSVVGNPIPWFTPVDGFMPQLTGRTQLVDLVTGRTSHNRTADRFGITGTDLGILWDNGAGQTLMAVGDTMGNCIGDAQWRSNVLFRSGDGALADGMNLDDAPMEAPGLAKSIIPRTGIPGVERTTIPTAGISVAGKQYLRYMSVIDWGQPGHWETNYSALAVSGDNGENWASLPWTWRVSGQNRFPLGPANDLTYDVDVPGPTPDSPPRTERRADPPVRLDEGQMSAFLKRGDFAYEYLTPSGRQGDARLARVRIRNAQDGTEYSQDFENPRAYEYWDGHAWVGDPHNAAPVLPAPVSELSVSYNDYLGRYIALYTNAENNIVMRQADAPEGPWSGEDVLLSSRSLPSIYGAYVHPWSNGRDLYYTVSTWDAYNVFLARTDLDAVRRESLSPENRPDPATTGEVVETGRTPIPGF